MRRTLFTLLLAIVALFSASAERIGTWISHQAYNNATKCITVGNKIFALYDGNLLSYGTQDNEIRTYSKVEGLSDNGISFISYSAAAKLMLAVYKDGNIDIIDPENETISNSPQLKNNSLGSLTVNDVSIYNDKAYIATTLGVAEFDIKNRQLQNFYNLGKSVVSCVRNGDNLYAAMTGSGIMWGNVKDNLLDTGFWKTMLDNWGLVQLASFNGYVYLRGNGAIFARFTNADDVSVISSDNFTYMTVDNNHLFAGNSKACYMYTTEKSEPTIWKQSNNCSTMIYANDSYFWSALGNQGLQRFTLDATADTLVAKGSPIVLNSPIRDMAYYMRYDGGSIYVAGGSVNYVNKFYQGTVMQYDGTKWVNYEENFTNPSSDGYWNAVSIAKDPADASHVFVSSASSGLFEFRNGKFVKNYSNRNSPLKSFSSVDSHYTRVDGLNFDTDGNLWMTNYAVDSVICILKKDGNWTRLYNADFTKVPSPEKTFFDSKGRFWVSSRRSTAQGGPSGILRLDYGGTVDDTSDDSWAYRTSFTNQDGTVLSPDIIYTIVPDVDGTVWVGTSSGVFTFNPETWNNSDFYVTQPKIPRNDGTNYADYLLANIAVSAIAVDPLNRKWIGTSNSGLYLVSADGTSVLEQFNSTNSKLPSNAISSIAINQKTGEVLIGTDVGMIGYVSDATEGGAKISKSDVLVYPNPVRPDYFGKIHISGLPVNYEVRITSSTGQVVASGISELGSYDWDGRDLSGRRVKSGIYYILLNNSEGKNGVAAKVTIVR